MRSIHPVFLRRFALALLPLLAATGALADPYRVRFRDVPEWGLRGALLDASEAHTLRDHPPSSALLLQRRGERDTARLLELLHARGYYGAKIAVRVTGAPDRQKLVFDIDAGPRYRFGDIVLRAEGLSLPSPARVGLRRGRPARATDALVAEANLLQHARRMGHPFPRLTERSYRADPAQARLHVTLTLDPGAVAHFGPVTITGAVHLSETYLRDELRWKDGARYDPDLLEDARARLVRSGLFASVALTPQPDADEGDALSLTLAVLERRLRTVAIDVGYASDEGAGIGFQWEHRNLWGDAERLRLGVRLAEEARVASATLVLPQKPQPDMRLELELRASEETPDAYQTRQFRAGTGVVHERSRRAETRTGIALRHSRVDQFNAREYYLLLSLPSALHWSNADDRLDPRRGRTIRIETEPFHDLEGGDAYFWKNRVVLQQYWPLDRAARTVLAGRAAGGVIFGASRFDLPADERFYAGGASSVRGYAYQSLGPLRDGEPTGGRSLVETSVEIRTHLSRTIGMVAFMDGGTAFEATTPDFHERVRWGAGVGLRYFTPAGPLRADVGFPLNRRTDIDRSVQFYVSLGQAF